jgi:hypothetical protein
LQNGSDVGEQDIVGPLVPVVLLPVVVSSWTRNLLLEHFLVESRVFALERRRWLQVLSLFLFSVLLLDLLDDVVIFEVLLRNLALHLLEPFLTNTKSWLFDDQIRVLFLLLYHLSRNIVVIYAVSRRRWIRVRFGDALPHC